MLEEGNNVQKGPKLSEKPKDKSQEGYPYNPKMFKEETRNKKISIPSQLNTPLYQFVLLKFQLNFLATGEGTERTFAALADP